jgi:hypothetical protein
MKVIDNRAKKVFTTFGELNIGDAFQDDDGDICIKTDVGAAIYWAGGRWAFHAAFDSEELIISLEITYLISRKEQE